MNKHFNFINKNKKKVSLTLREPTYTDLVAFLFLLIKLNSLKFKYTYIIFMFYSFFFTDNKLLNIFVENHKATDAHMELITLPPL